MNEPVKSKRSTEKKRGRGRGSVGSEVIVRSAREMLTHTPPARLSRKDVAIAAGVDPALVRYYFSDLGNLLTDVLKLLVEEFKDLQDPEKLAGLKPSEALKQRTKNLVLFLTENPNYHALFVERIIYGEDEWALNVRNEFTDKYYENTKDIVAQGRRDGVFREDFDTRFYYLAVIGAAGFLVTSGPIMHRLFPDVSDPKDVASAYANFLWDVMFRGIVAK